MNVSERIVDVAIPTRVAGTFHYSLPDELADGVAMGSVVQVPFGRRSLHGFVLGFSPEPGIDRSRLKAVGAVLIKEPVFDETMLGFLRWVSEYYCHPLGEVIAAAVPRGSVEHKAKPKRSRGHDKLLAKLEADGVPSAKPELTDEQRVAVETITSPDSSQPVLLHGVTGSGKTEVYLNVLEHVLGQGKGAIILVPEIALTPQLLGRFSARFPGQVAVLHSDLTPKERIMQWERLRSGQARVVVGARSAVFAPIRDLGLIVVDEEHEASYKQEESFRYHARDVAVVRGSLMGAKVVLGSATPSLETYSNAKSGKYIHVQLTKRVGSRRMPTVTFVDLKDKAACYHMPTGERVHWLSDELANRIGRTLKAGHQSMLFLNRLGFAHFLFCSDCGHTWRCRQCDVALTYYKSPPGLKCHYCGAFRRPPDVCEACSGMNLAGMGLGTEQVEVEIGKIFPQARVMRLDRSAVKTRKELESRLERIAARDVDIVIGTQMIAKGHDFPGVALVGVLVADASLNLPDFRANERTFQILTQVSGRAGRADIEGEVVVQTLNPEHPVLRAAGAHDWQSFYSTEIEARRQFGFPPHRRLAMMRFQHSRLPVVESFARTMVDKARFLVSKHGWRCTLMGPAEAPLSRLKNQFRWQALIKSDSSKHLQALLRALHEEILQRKSPVQTAFDVDPINSL